MTELDPLTLFWRECVRCKKVILARVNDHECHLCGGELVVLVSFEPDIQCGYIGTDGTLYTSAEDRRRAEQRMIDDYERGKE